MKITLFFCAGNFAETLGIHKISAMNGVGQRMPWTMTAFTLAAMGMIGMPPVAGFVSKWYLGVGAVEAGAYWVIAILAISSLLNAAYFLPILFAAWFKPADGEWPAERRYGRWETHWMLLLPPLITAVLAMLTGLLASSVVSPLSWAKLITLREYGLETLQVVPQMSLAAAPWLWLTILLPLLLALSSISARLRRWSLAAAPWAAVPALVAALLPTDAVHRLPWLFFGSVLGLDDVGRIFLLLAALLWLAAGLYARAYLREDDRRARFFLFFLLAMSGNFGLILAQDAFGFITFFTLMSLAAYGLVTHNGDKIALQAGKTYMQWLVIGEVLLFAGLTGWVQLSGSSDLRELAAVPRDTWITVLLIAGFGIKAGLIPLHVWLPRAHPVAPIPASAVLSGIMVKAGLLGWLRLLPGTDIANHSDAGDWGIVLIGLGLVGAFLGVLVGVVQRNPKTLLAYSTISQMGIIATGVGAGLLLPEIQPLLLSALLLYALHHGLAKGALFMSVGIAPQLVANERYRWLLWAAILLPALALAGLPFTSGAVAKAALKTAVTELTWLTALLPLTAVGTTLLMARFIDLLRQTASANRTNSGLLLPYLLLLLPVAGLIYSLPEAEPFLSAAFSPAAFWTASWPLLLGLALYLISRRYLNHIPPVPAGDIVVPIETVLAKVQRLTVRYASLAGARYADLQNLVSRLFAFVAVGLRGLRQTLASSHTGMSIAVLLAFGF